MTARLSVEHRLAGIMRGPFSDTLLDGRAGQVADVAGGPLGVLKAGVFVVAVTLTFSALVLGIEAVLGAIFGPWLPGWLALPIVVVSVGIVIMGVFIGFLRFMTWRRRTS